MALAMSLVFLQALVGDLVHVGHVEHAYCPEHREVTHDLEHVKAVHASYAASAHTIAHEGMVSAPAKPRHDHQESPFDCGELAWIFSMGVPLTPALGALAPAFAFATDPPHARAQIDERTTQRSVPLHFHASGLSPPPIALS